MFKPYAGVATAALIFEKTDTRNLKPDTRSVWFYDITADGFSLDDKRTPIEANDIPDVLAKWEKREEGPNSYRVPVEKIRENDWSLAAGRYKPVTTVAVNHDAPADTPRVDSLTELGATMSRPVKAGTIVMAVSGNIGLCAQLAVDACVHDGFVAFKELRADMFVPLFFGIAMSQMHRSHQRNQAGAIFQNITTSDVKAMKIPLPPLPLQQEFARRVVDIRELEAGQAAARRRLESLFQSMLHRAFNGEL